MNFVERMKSVIGQGLDTTKEALSIAKDKAKEMGEKGVIKYEINRLEKQVEKKFALLGSNVYSILVEKEHNTITKNTTEIKNILIAINDLQKKIEEREENIKKLK